MKTSEFLELVLDKLETVGWRNDAEIGDQGGRCLVHWIYFSELNVPLTSANQAYSYSDSLTDTPYWSGLSRWNDKHSYDEVLALVMDAISAALSDGD